MVVSKLRNHKKSRTGKGTAISEKRFAAMIEDSKQWENENLGIGKPEA